MRLEEPTGDIWRGPANLACSSLASNSRFSVHNWELDLAELQGHRLCMFWQACALLQGGLLPAAC